MLLILCSIVPTSINAQSALSKPWNISAKTLSPSQNTTANPDSSLSLGRQDYPAADPQEIALDECSRLVGLVNFQLLSKNKLLLASKRKRECALLLLNSLQSNPNRLFPAAQEALAKALKSSGGGYQALFHLYQARFRQGKSFKAAPLVNPPPRQKLPLWQQAEWLLIQAEVKARKQQFTAAAAWLLEYQKLPLERPRASQKDAERMLSYLNDPQALERFIQGHPRDTWLENRRYNISTPVFLNAGQIDKARKSLAKAKKKSSSDKQNVKQWKREIAEQGKKIQPFKIGVLLPFSSSSSQLKQYSAQILDGLRLAVQDRIPQTPLRNPTLPFHLLKTSFAALPKGKNISAPPIELVLRDTGNQPRQAFRAVRELARQEKVIAIIGPLAKVESEAAAQAAAAENIPLLAFSPSMKLPEQSQFVFKNSRSIQTEIADLADFAVGYLQLKRFAILYPKTSPGRLMRDLFWSEISARQGKIVAVAGFEPLHRLGKRAAKQGLGLETIFSNFTGLNRPLSLAQQQLLKDSGDPHPDPIVDFEALFIPISSREVLDLTQIARYPATVDAEQVQMLGNRFWNNNNLLATRENQLLNAVISNTIDHSNQNIRFQKFLHLHRLMFGYRYQYQSPSYYPTIGYDTLRYLQALLGSPRNHSRWKLARSLKDGRVFQGIAGWSRYGTSGQIEKEVSFLQIRQKSWQRISP